ncbi:MAG: hypothetical protein QOE39_1515 [Bradyrhizobium sp.]|jgi:hypothetical protein|nr:hypothetical protein [Bradyrhizobium sp.]
MVVEELPRGGVGDMVPVVLPTLAVGMVPNGTAAVIVVDGIVVAALPAMDVETVFGIVGAEAVAGNAGTATTDVGGTGMVVPGSVDIKDDNGVADSNNGAVPLVVGVEEAGGMADVVGAADTDGTDPVAPPTADIDVTGTAAVPGVICSVGAEQVTTVPGVEGSEASGTGASVVSGTLGWVVAENGLGPLSGDVTIVPGVDERPMAVLPMVETCARLALQPASRIAVVNSKRRIAIAPSASI